jgi:hypothetical protein
VHRTHFAGPSLAELHLAPPAKDSLGGQVAVSLRRPSAAHTHHPLPRRRWPPRVRRELMTAQHPARSPPAENPLDVVEEDDEGTPAWHGGRRGVVSEGNEGGMIGGG